MALNFPSNPQDQSIYVDPSSGLKYIYNLSIGGWETAIQPPCIVSLDGAAPDLNLDGFLYYDNVNKILYIFRNGEWVPVTENTSGTTKVTVSATRPGASNQGDLWWDSVGGALYIYYVDEDSSQWVIAAPAEGGGGTSSSNVYVGPTPPPNAKEGDMYFNNLNEVLYVYNDGNWDATRSESDGVNQITVVDPIRDLGASDDPIIAIYDAAIDQAGAIRLATQDEVDAPESNTTQALTPSRLLVGIDAYLPQATEDRKGVLAVATAAEVSNGTDNEKAVTPATLGSFAQSNANPAGTVITFAGETVPTGYLECDGSIFDRATYPNLFNAINTIYTYDDDPDTQFRVPDLRGEFVRGWSNGKAGIDVGRALGSFQGDQFAEHAHGIATGDAAAADGLSGGGNRVSDTITVNTNTAGSGTETRPRNFALMYCIKY